MTTEGNSPTFRRSPRNKRRWRWWLLLFSRALFVLSLLAPNQPGGSWKPEVPAFILVFALTFPARFTLSFCIATTCFLASPLLVGIWPPGMIGVFWRLVAVGILLAWWPSTKSYWSELHMPPVTLVWGYYLWASAYTLAFVAALIRPPLPPPKSDQRRRGFAVILPPQDSPKGESGGRQAAPRDAR